jgi:hypothetical protein
MDDATTDHPIDPDEVPLRARGWGIPILLAAVAIVAVMVIGGAVAALLNSGGDGETLTFVVPEGTAERGYLGETVDIMPSEVQLRVGDTLVVRNDDTQTATVGPFTVRPGETLEQRFQRPQTLIGECTLSGTGEIKIVVT